MRQAYEMGVGSVTIRAVASIEAYEMVVGNIIAVPYDTSKRLC